MKPNLLICDITGIIYMITNKTNSKRYIGKTYCLENEKDDESFKRWKEHKRSPFSKSKHNRNAIPKLYDAIREEGIDNFNFEVLLFCRYEDTDQYEIDSIAIYMTMNDKFGYNSTAGGGGINSFNISEELRAKMSKCKHSHDFELNIRPYKEDGIHVGYRVRRVQYGILYDKIFMTNKKTLSENLQDAREFLNKIKSNSITEQDLIKPKDSNLPKYIIYTRRSELGITCYCVRIQRKKKRYEHKYESKYQTMEQKLQRAIQKRNEILTKLGENLPEP